jgi:hypothetical protein
MAETKPKGDPVFLTIPTTGEKITLSGVTSLNSQDELKAAAQDWLAKNYKGPELGEPIVFRTPKMGEEGGFAPGEEIVVQASALRPFEGSVLGAAGEAANEVIGEQLGFDPSTIAMLAPDQGLVSQFNRNLLETAQPAVRLIETAAAAPYAALNSLTQLAYNLGIGTQDPRRTAAEIQEFSDVSGLKAAGIATPRVPSPRDLVREVPTPSTVELPAPMQAIAAPTPELPTIPRSIAKQKPVEVPETKLARPAFENEIPAPLPEVNLARANVLKNGENYRTDLTNWTPKLYRETSPKDLEVFLPTGGMETDLKDTDLFFADTPDLALGQGANKGVLMEFDATGLSGKLNKGKPSWRLGVENASGSEFIANLNPTGKYRRNLSAVRVSKNVTLDKVTQERLPRALNKLEQEGWVKTETDEFIQYSRPQAAEMPEAPALTAQVPEAPVVPTPTAAKIELLEPPAAVEIPPAPKITEAEGRAALLNLEKKDLTNPLTTTPVTKKVADFAADYINAAGVSWNRETPFIDFFRQHYYADTLPPETLQELYKKYDFQEHDWTELLTGTRQSVGDMARGLAYLKAASNKIPKTAVELAEKYAKELPPPSLWTRSGNALRGSYLAEVAKVTRDLASGVVNMGLDPFTQTIDNVVTQVLVNPVKAARGLPQRPINYGDAFVLFSQGLAGLPSRAARAVPFGLAEKAEKLVPSQLRSIDAQNKKLLDQLASNAPKVSRAFLDVYSSDNVRPTLSDKFGKVESAVDTLNFLSRWNDGMMRKTIFPAFLKRATNRAGFNFDELVASEKIHTLPEEVTKKAINDTLSFVFNRRAEKGGPLFLGETSREVIDFLNNKGGPISAVTIGYPEFIANAWNYMWDYGPGITRMFTPKGVKKVMDGDVDALSKGLVGTALFLSAVQFRESDRAGSQWYTAKNEDGTEVDLRPIFPAPYYLLLADLYKRAKDGTIDLAYTTADIVQGLSGAQFRAGSSLYIVDELARDLSRAGEFGDKGMDAVKKTIGSALGGIIPFGGTIKDVVGSVEQAVSDNPQETITRDTSEAPFLGAALREVPFAQTRLLQLPEQEYASRAGPRMNVDPLQRQLIGLAKSTPATIVETEMDRLGLTSQDLYKNEGFPALDRRQKQLIGDIAEYNAPSYFNSPAYRNADKLTQTEMFREFYKGVRATARNILKAENPNFTALTWYNDQSREDKIRIDNEYKQATGQTFRKFYSQLVAAPLVNTKEEFDALPKGTKYTDPGDYKVYTKGE